MLGLVGNFLFIIGALAILNELLRPGNTTSAVIQSLSSLMTDSIKAAKS